MISPKDNTIIQKMVDGREYIFDSKTWVVCKENFKNVLALQDQKLIDSSLIHIEEYVELEILID